MLRMYAIPNCDTVKKARTFLEKKKADYEFIDFKKTPPTVELIKQWTEFLGELPVNKKGLTYKKVKDEFEALKTDKAKMEFMIKNSSMIKRPILENNKKTVAVGFEEAHYSSLKF